MANLPTLGEAPKRRSIVALIPVLAISVAGAGGFWALQSCKPKVAAAAPVDAGPAIAEAPKPPPTPEQAMNLSGLKRAHAVVNGPLEKAIVDAAGPQVGPSLNQVVNRALVWWMDVPTDFRKGDTVDVLYEERNGQEPVVHAVRYVSTKLGQTFSAYRFQAKGDAWSRLYLPDGQELELRLKDAPLEDYEQVTSHLRDGRRHKGVDFKTPLGSKVHATFAGTVLRKTWSFRGNGNSLDIGEPSGRHAEFLHLSEIPPAIKVGSKIEKAQVIAASGNTGHSFAPHLHYQLMLGEKLLDPFKAQETYRRPLAADQKPAFDAQVHKLDGWMGNVNVSLSQ